MDSLSHVFPAFVKVQRKERCPLYKILSTLAGVYTQWTTLRTCIDYQLRVHATATPVQVVHVRTERTIVNEPAKRRCVSPAPREFARNWDTRRLWLSTAEETCILLFRPLCFVPGSEAVFAALVKRIVVLPARSRSSSQF